MRTLRNRTLLLLRSSSEDCASSEMVSCGREAAACAGAAARARSSPARQASPSATSSRRRLRLEAAIDLGFQMQGAVFQVGDESPGRQGVSAELDPHVTRCARDALRDVVAKRLRVNHRGTLMLRALTLDAYIPGHVDHVAARLDVRGVAEHDPGLAVGRLVIEAHMIKRDLRSVIDLIDALRLDAQARVPR